jgi:regulator of replication initiation timing
MESDVARTEREKHSLIAEITTLHSRIGALTLENASLNGANGALRESLAAAQTQRDELLIRCGELVARCGELGDHKEAFEEAQRTIAVLYGEIGRLQGLLDRIYGSRTWKLHTIVERMKGRG